MGQFVTDNIFGLVNLAYIIVISPANVTVIPVDEFANSVIVGFDDIYSVEDEPFYEKFLFSNRLLHKQHVLDYIANEKLEEELIQLNDNH